VESQARAVGMANVLSYALLATISSACLRGLADDSVGLWIAPLVPILCQPGMQGRDPTKVLVNGETGHLVFITGIPCAGVPTLFGVGGWGTFEW